MSSSSTRKVAKLVEIAGRDTTGDEEALNAIRLARKLAQEQGKEIADILGGTRSSGVSTTSLTYNQYQERMDQLESALQKAAASVSTLEKNLGKTAASYERKLALADQRVQKKLDGLTATFKYKPNNDGTVPYGQFVNMVKSRLNMEKGWQRQVSLQLNISKSVINTYASKGKVPADIADRARSLREERPEEKPSNQRWTLAEVNRLRELDSDPSMTEELIARALTSEFGRTITDGSIKRMKLNSRLRQNVFKDASFGPPIGKNRDDMKVPS